MDMHCSTQKRTHMHKHTHTHAYTCVCDKHTHTIVKECRLFKEYHVNKVLKLLVYLIHPQVESTLHI